jgi:hypothetical protein
MVKTNVHYLRWLNSFLVILYLVIGLGYPSLAQSKKPNSSAQEEQTPAKGEGNGTEDPNDPNSSRPLNQADSILSLEGGQKLVSEAQDAINNGKYDLAVAKLQQARKIFNQLSNFHLQLANSFSGIDPKVTESQRSKALQTGQLRDETTYQLALVHRAQNKPELAVPLLIQVILSQNPSSELGRKSYQQLYELGFVDVPYSPSSTQPNTPPKQP